MNSKQPNALNVETLDKKYQVILSSEGFLLAKRYGQSWRNCVGDGLISTLAQDIETLNERIKTTELKLSTAIDALKRISDYSAEDYQGRIKKSQEAYVAKETLNQIEFL